MKYMGIWPEERHWYLPSSYVILIPVLMMLCFCCIPQTANIPVVYSDMYMLVENLSMANISITISMLKTTIFWANGKSIKSLLKCMASDWNRRLSSSDRKIMTDIAKITRKTILTSTVAVNIMVIAYVVRYTFIAMYTDRKLFFHAYFPYDVKASPNIQLTVAAQLIGGIYAAGCYTAVDTFIAMLILHVCGQLTILKHDIMNLREDGDEKLRVVLGRIIERHEYINASVLRNLRLHSYCHTYESRKKWIRFAGTIENCFNAMLLLQMLGCTLQLCFQCFQVIMVRTMVPIYETNVEYDVWNNSEEIFELQTFSDEDKNLMSVQISFLSIYVIYIMAQLYLYCYVGDRLTIEGRQIANAAYNCAWYNLSANNARLLIIIMCRDLLPLRITAGRFCSFTLQLYSEILKRSMGYISVLYTMQNK
nr:odorant receptor 67c-like [Megalopta genalis]